MKPKEKLTEREIRKRIASAEHIIDVKKRQIPKLKEQLMWALYAQCEEGAQKKFMMIWNSITEQKNRQFTPAQDRDNLIALLERTLKQPENFVITEDP